MNPPGHVMILASAGSGKTYALTDRFVALLAAGAAPERIAALTFTRKAAGEFFDEILRKLARAAADDAAARRLAADVGAPAFTRGDFRRLLRAVTGSMHRLQLGTLDSFFGRIVRAFPLELGLGGDFELLEESAARRERRRVLRAMFGHAGGRPDAAQQDFIEAFKRATFGREEKRLGDTLDRFIDEFAEAYLEAPDAEAWGGAGRIWPAGAPWFEHAAPRARAAAAAALHAALPWAELNEKQRERWDRFFAELPAWSPGAELPKPVGYILGNALAEWPVVAEVRVERKKLALPPAASAALRRLAGGLVGAELVRRLEMTHGVFAVLRGYDRAYDRMVRRTGRLTFADVQRLLRPVALTGATPDEGALFLDWRLDARVEHWLLDEFQDTSFGQWKILRNLIDEAVQDATGARSFFYVGDVKQAIFTWREGDPRLFREIFDHYNAAAPGTIREQRLDRSWRSGPAVVEMVNRVLGGAQALQALLPEEVAARWNREWRPHESARPELGGFAGLGHADDETGRWAATRRVLEETQALGRGLSVAVLVQKNATAAALADFLRREGGFPAVAESDLHVGTDNPLAGALLALLRVAAHPGDAAAWAQVRMTPIARVLAAEGCDTRDALVQRVLGEVHTDGFELTLEAWVRRIEPMLAVDDAFSRLRARQLIEAARSFDETGSREVAEFAAFVARHTVREADTVGVVRVMTVHKAKGLGFDLVILPDLEGRSLTVRRRGLAMKRAADRSVEWVLDLPAEEFFGADPALRAYAEAAAAEAAYEKLCLLYVAMTRAKRAMYVVTEPAGTSSSRNYPRLLRDTLGESWSSGDPQWFKTVVAPAVPPVSPGEIPMLDHRTGSRAPRRPARAASTWGGPGRGQQLAQLFAPRSADGGPGLGRAVHALLAQVGWLAGRAEIPAWIAAWREQGAPEAAVGAAAACLQAPDLAEIWRPCDGELWRERAFELVLDGAWVSGVVDRVIVEREADGRARRATVFDFKTDALPDETEVAAAVARHAAQLLVYRRAVARLTGLGESAVKGELVFTRLARRVPAGGWGVTQTEVSDL
ncbi:MAG: UvrD-helicase domain-containing protein [Verrucomicrobia bacterium]|nr:UvrD-helicase domain-containing protein [Verrucomicrobiota bacterium]